MKKILPIIVLALIVPHIALASWWNPFSWNVFRKSESKTQVLENRVKELEKKLDSTATSTIKKEESQPTKKIETPTVIQKTVTPPQSNVIDTEQAFKDLLNQYNLFQKQLEIDITKFNNIRSDNPYYEKRADYTENLLNDFRYTVRVLESFSGSASKTRELIDTYKTKLFEIKKEYNFRVKDYEDLAEAMKTNITLPTPTTSREAKLSDIDRRIFPLINDYIVVYDDFYSKYKTYYSDRERYPDMPEIKSIYQIKRFIDSYRVIDGYKMPCNNSLYDSIPVDNTTWKNQYESIKVLKACLEEIYIPNR